MCSVVQAGSVGRACARGRPKKGGRGVILIYKYIASRIIRQAISHQEKHIISYSCAQRTGGQGKTNLSSSLPDHEFVGREPADETERDERSDDGREPGIARNVLTGHVYVHAPNTFFFNKYQLTTSCEKT